MMNRSKLRALRRAREWNHVADVAHAGQKQQHPLQAEAEARMRHRAVAAQIKIPPVRGRVEALLLHTLFEHVETLLALAAANDLADAGDEYIHRPNRFAV